MTDGENTPAAVNAPPKIAPDAIDFRVAEDISGREARLPSPGADDVGEIFKRAARKKRG
jgi:hypothetical protein